jgi:hypothetical protein
MSSVKQVIPRQDQPAAEALAEQTAAMLVTAPGGHGNTVVVGAGVAGTDGAPGHINQHLT